MIRTPYLFALSLVCSLHATTCFPAQYQFKTIALTGERAPGSGGSGVDVPFTAFGTPSINTAGEVAFYGVTTPNVDGGDAGVFSTVGGMLNAVAFEQQLAPGSGGSGADVPFTDIHSPKINSTGEVVFYGATTPNADGGDAGVFSTVGGMLNAVAFEQQIAPGSGGSGPDVPFTSVSSNNFFNASGVIAFRAGTSPNIDGGNWGIFTSMGGMLNAVAFERQIAPGSGGSGPDVPFTEFTAFFGMNDTGDVAFSALTSPNAERGSRGVFRTVEGTLEAVGFSNQIAPGSGGSGADVPFFSFFGGSDINASGDIAFIAFTTPNADGGNIGVFRTMEGTLEAVAFSRQIAPGSGGGGADVPFTLFFGSPGINASGEVVFQGVTSPNVDGGSIGVFSTAGGTLEAVAFSQSIAPGSGGSGADVPFSLNFGQPAINSFGEVAFAASTSPNADGGDNGIFANVGGDLRAIIFEGNQVEVSPSDFRVVSSLSFALAGGFSDGGELTFRASFTDGSEGIFVWSPLAVPEPSAALLLSVSGLVFYAAHRRLHSPTRKVSA